MESETIISEQFYSNSSSVISEKALNSSFFGTKEKSQKIHVERPTSPFGLAVLIATFLLMIAGVYLVVQLQDDFEQFHFERIASTWGLPFLIITTILFLYQTGVFLYSSYLYLRYKAIPSVSDDLLPTCTIIVPAYNEGKLVWDTLMSLAESDYPAEKLQLLAIDDGSKDDTWYWMQEAKAKLGDRVTIFQQPKNAGKRHALYRGFKLGTGEIFVTVDSDSIVKKDTLRNLVSPFVVNKKCGAVAGNVQVLNNKKAILPKMLNVSFVMSFEFQRSAESEAGAVLCTPGALAAYRRDAVFNCLPEWINQTFMGQPSDIGEDRAMTNMILKQGFHVLFQRNAVVLTNVPEDYKGLYKMFIRWSRSNVRENLMMAKYAFKDFRKESKFGARLFFLNQSFKILMTYPFLLFMFFFIAVHPVLFLSSTLMAILIFSSFTMLFYAKRYTLAESFWAYSYSLFYTFSLFWIAPYAIATASKRGWLTRGL
ncbi:MULTISPECIES: glycosyltransferase family 2 protein [unclassified Flavobacterium]|jgi:hyaluronan synthase|uniref:glycosyltransferase n=1 Tax=unclassified Flavobacterium TaxID=196869 RepID=UPI00070C3785|nr:MULTISPECIES: glycosyltransferase family 2 protein [unclassified Flavobacterium]KRD61745.1 glycosyl transferase family 2 [Flavobacterium sp. Root935]TDX12377.1 hyaluronan synthase [Flavobacterium sp. S87F.05.LMB.W.Kidney.N]BDU27430.1 chitin synthase [Flavobacterium sp. GSB-24]